MHRLFDEALASRADRSKAQHWAGYALRHYGAGAAERLRLGLDPAAGVTDRRALRMAIRHAERRANQQISIAVVAGDATLAHGAVPGRGSLPALDR